jgi:hypothetical protein
MNTNKNNVTFRHPINKCKRKPCTKQALNSQFYSDFIKYFSLHIYHFEITSYIKFVCFCKHYPHIVEELKNCQHTKYYRDFFEVFDAGWINDWDMQSAIDIFWCGVNRERD